MGQGKGQDDQRRVMTPVEAIRMGADYIVVGRPIVAARDPLRAASEIVSEMERGAVDPERENDRVRSHVDRNH